MELTETLGTAFLYLRSFWHTEALSEEAEGQNLPEELIVEILVKLPVKSLLRFRCVCKSWFQLIKSTNFVKRHLNHHKDNDNILVSCVRKARPGRVISMYSHESRPRRVISFTSYESLGVISPCWEIPHFDNLLPDYVCGPCDGLLCFSNYGSSTLMLCNPAMREFKLLPPYPFPYEEGGRELIAIGLGFDSIKNDYKVIAIVLFYDNIVREFLQKAVVYNLSTKSWREIDCNIGCLFIDLYYCGTLFNGTVHWIESEEDKLILFDMNTEVFSEMELPYIDPEEETEKRLMVLNGSLALFTYKFKNRPQFVNIWVMHRYGVIESWTKQLIIGPVTEYLQPLFLWKNEEVISKDIFVDMFSISLCTHKKRSFNIRGIQGPINVATVYGESLISIN